MVNDLDGFFNERDVERDLFGYRGARDIVQGRKRCSYMSTSSCLSAQVFPLLPGQKQPMHVVGANT